MKPPTQRQAGYTLDLDSTRLLLEDGHQKGVAVGYTRQGLKPCLHPLLAVLAEVRLVAQLWLRPGNTACVNNAVAFFLDLRDNLPSQIRLGRVRASAGFCLPELLDLWKRLPVPYVVAAKSSQPIQKFIKVDLDWTATEVADLEYQTLSWPQPRRLVLFRHRCGRGRPARGQMSAGRAGVSLSSVGHQSAAATHPPLAVWRYYYIDM